MWLQDKDPILGAKLNHSRVASASDGAMEIEVLEIYEGTLKEPQSLVKLTDAAGQFFGRTLEWVVRTRSTVQADPREAHKVKASKVNPKRLVMENPVVQQAIEVLGGELLDIRGVKPEKSGRE
jgi:DNA polymerase-3 subunit gamma/tau